ncbi:MAG: hypothetical protein DHS20C11_30550 [Lysobacteraceae bacterium]|nr:MAG: hypothetical protein DHS20C11_30550 [Xanthomonadaceae bacterium]
MAEPAQSKRQRWRRRGAEILTIVFGIMLALFLDALWQDYEKLALEDEYLKGLALEFAKAEEELVSDQERREEILGTIDYMLDQKALPAEMKIQHIIGRLYDFRFYTPSHSMLEDLLSSGRLHYLRSDDLRRALLRYIQEKERLQAVEVRETQFAADYVEPVLVEHFDLRELYYEENGVDQSQRLLALLSDPSFTNILVLRAGRTETSLRFGNYLTSWIERVRELLPAVPNESTGR